jgi:hypothetical protein
MLKDQIYINIPCNQNESLLFAIETCINHNLYKGKILYSQNNDLPSNSVFLNMIPFNKNYYDLLLNLSCSNFYFLPSIYKISFNQQYIFIVFKFFPWNLYTYSKSLEYSHKSVNEKVEFSYYLNNKLLDISHKLYSNNIIFFNFHPKNIFIEFIEDDFNIFILDFKLCNHLDIPIKDEKLLYLIDNLEELYVHPNVFLEKKLNHYVDYYSIACIIFKLIFQTDYHDHININYSIRDNNYKNLQNLMISDYKINNKNLNNLYLTGLFELELNDRNLIALMKITLSKYLDKIFNTNEQKLSISDLIDYLNNIPKSIHLPFSR